MRDLPQEVSTCAAHRLPYSTSTIISTSTGGVAGKPCHADGRASMLSDRLAEHLNHQIGKPVHHLGLVAETLGRIDHAENLDDALDAIEAAERGPHLSQHDDPGLARRLVALLDGEVLPDLAFERPLGARRIAGEKQQLPGLHGVDEVGGGAELGGNTILSSFSLASAPPVLWAGAEPGMAISARVTMTTTFNGVLMSRLLRSPAEHATAMMYLLLV